MGLLWTIGALAGGYVAGMKLGDRPLLAAKDAIKGARGQKSTRSSTREASTFGDVDVRRVDEVMSSPIQSVRPGTSLRDAAKIMQRSSIGDVLVVSDSGELRGIVTDRDLAIRAVAEERDPGSTQISEILSPVSATVMPEATVAEALQLMRRFDVRRLPVVQDNIPVGMVSLGDLARSTGAGRALADISTAPANN